MENKKKIEDDDQVCWKHQDDDGLKEEEEESEEMKMEKFYSLIRNYHDARNRLRLRNATRRPPPQVQSDDHEVLSDNKVNSNKRRKKMGGDDDDAGGGGGRGGGGKIWVPSFELGDFANEVEFRGSLYSCNNIITSTASTAEQKQDDGKNESLDLKLTL
ncbi:protein NIM1-INTERACTING 1 [Pyrus ussuriensis x Pyrus communis]|uniref:Protein NIM1-INTERACTING 1 n=1 Tax=Pyrus ussuriensis x Pyrus communis TaxID=2448454 RepID=A0A5N5G8F8_9ROSA|nr:protein NIM1-INTERACTING 1 [Pyrus ussuriensis x Pyrus communis]